jgi:transcriptional regulator with XRE-family HTH domain
MILTGRQVREGRILAGLSQDDLATAAEVAVGLITRVEAVDGMAMVKKPDLAAIQGALEAAGVEFIPENGGGAGVKLRKADG